MMQVREMFSSPIATDFLELDNTALEIFCRERFFDSVKYKKHTLIQTDDLMSHEHPVLQQLIKLVQDKANEFHQQIGLSDSYKQRIVNCWANLDTNWSIRTPHQHPEGALACVYYVTGEPNSGDLEFINPNTSLMRTFFAEHIAEFNKFTANTFKSSPKPGKLIIFPAWLYHYVNTGTSDTDRISIAFNTAFETKKEIL